MPPYILRPTMRLAYWTGMRRWPCSTNTTPTMMTSVAATTAVNTRPPRLSRMVWPSDGIASRDAGEDQQRHAVADAAFGDQLAHPHHQRRACGQHQHDDDRGRRCYELSWMMSRLQPCSSPPLAASATMLVACRTASAIDR